MIYLKKLKCDLFSFSIKNKNISCFSSSTKLSLSPQCKMTTLEEVKRFDIKVPIEEAVTPPSSWYTSREFYLLEMEKIFKKNWISIHSKNGLEQPNDYITGEIIDQPYVLINNPQNELKAFYNVCSHHAARVASGKGKCDQFVCPYHGWTYNTDGNLTKSTSMKGIKNFRPKNYGLKPIKMEKFGNVLLLNLGGNLDKNDDFLKLSSPLFDELKKNNFDPTFNDLSFVKRKDYHMNCNWKVFIDNYCDGGYHVPFAHKNLNQGLDLSTYSNYLFDKCSIQSVSSNSNNPRLGNRAVYGFLYPNTIFNRYGPWLDINVVIPINENETIVRIEWFIDSNLIADEKFIEDSIKASEEVQEEDVFLCETVMKGLKSDGYDTGRYVPSKETPAYRFHQDLYSDLISTANS